MKSVRRPFDKLIEDNPCLSSYTCFTKQISKGNYGKGTISRWFYKLVDREDYLASEGRAILKYLVHTYAKKDA